MKQPRLPGAEKFKFASADKQMATSQLPLNGTKHHRTLSTSPSIENGTQPYYVFHSRASSVSSQSDIRPISSTLSVPTLNRNESKRRAVLPITSKKTCRMLTNTNAELSVDQVDVVPEDLNKMARLKLESSKVPSCPNLDSSLRSLHDSKTSLDTYFHKMSLQNATIKELPLDFDWKNIRASPSRFSASCSSSCSSEENVWVLREDS